MLGRGSRSSEGVEEIFRELCNVLFAEDGLIYEPETISTQKIGAEEEYEGIRVKLLARLENARIPLQVDIGFGDAVKAGRLEYPTLLSMPAPRIQAYPMVTVIAEKSEAIAHLGMLNSRMKDFFDIWFLARTFHFDAQSLSDALRATFDRRATRLDSGAFARLLANLSKDASKQMQWRGVSAQERGCGAGRFCGGERTNPGVLMFGN